jgi:PKD domain
MSKVPCADTPSGPSVLEKKKMVKMARAGLDSGNRTTTKRQGARQALLRVFGVIFLIIVSAGFGCASASAAPAWLAPNTWATSGPGALNNAALAVDPQGGALAVWWNGEGPRLEGAFRSAETLSWSPTVSPVLPGLGVSNPMVAVDGQGNATVVWERGLEEKIEAVVRSAADGSWQTPVTISPEGASASEPQVAVDGRRDAFAVWSEREGATGDTIWAAQRSSATGQWEPAVRLSEVGEPPYKDRFSRHPMIAIDAEGEAVAVWDDAGPEPQLVEAAVKLPSAAKWSAPAVIGSRGRMPQIAIDSSGGAVAVWVGEGGLYSAALPAASDIWQATTPIVTTEAEHPHIGLDSKGDAVASWESVIGGWESTPGTNTIQAAVKPVGGGWGPPVNLSQPVEYSHLYPTLNPSLTVGPQGAALVAWNGYRSSTDQTVQASALPSIGSSWQTPTQLADNGGSFVIPEVGMDEKGNGVAMWARGEHERSMVEAVDYDASSPALEGLQIPAAATMGQTLTFAASPIALTTALGQTTWTFGDGSTPASGTNVSHTFVAPGSYHVTVNAADLLGNTTSVSSTVLVSAPPRPRCRCKHETGPRLSGVRISPRRFRVNLGHRFQGRRSGLALGANFRFMLSEAATVQIRIARVMSRGRRLHCGATPRSGTRRPSRQCGRTRKLGVLDFPGEHGGKDEIRFFNGRVGGHVLSPGQYQATLTARNRFGRSNPVSVSFVIVG